MNAAWSSVPLGEVAQPVERPESPVSGTNYRQIGVRLWGEGAYERGSIDGGATQYRALYRMEEGDIVVNKIWARNGSVAVVPASLAGCYGSGEFPAFSPNRNRLDPRWVHWLTKTRAFWNACDKKSQGTSGKNRIRPEAFLQIAIPLPPLAEQRRIVARIEALAKKLDEARKLRLFASHESQSAINATRRRCIGEAPTSDWIPLSEFVQEIQNGWSPACENRPASNGEWGVLKVGAVSFGRYDPHENKALPISLEPKPECEIRRGDFLMGRANTTALTGACAVVDHTPPRMLLCDKIFRFVFRQNRDVDHRYLVHVLKSPPLRLQIERAATGTSSTMKNISKEKVLRLRIPARCLADQHRIVALLDRMEVKLGAVSNIQAETGNELDALLPSLLSQAFVGGL